MYPGTVTVAQPMVWVWGRGCLIVTNGRLECVQELIFVILFGVASSVILVLFIYYYSFY